MSDQLYQLLPPLTEDEYAALREDIQANGIRVPVDVDEDGQLLDGHHRAAIAGELGIPYPTRTVAGLTEDEKRHHALAVNLQRRTLTREQRRALIVAELEHDPSRSDRAIGRLTGTDHKTVAAVRRGGWGIPHPDETPAVMSKEEATRLTDDLRNKVVMADTEIMLALLGGRPASLVVQAIVEVAKDAGPTWWEHVISPRIEAVYAWPKGGMYRMRALETLTWPEAWSDYDAETAVEARRLLLTEFPGFFDDPKAQMYAESITTGDPGYARAADAFLGD